MRGLFGCFGVGMALLSAPFIVLAVVDIVAGNDVGMAIALTVFFAGTLASGGVIAKKNLGAKPERPALPAGSAEQLVLSHAASLGGRITVPELSLMAGIPVQAAKDALDALARQGVADVLVSEGGATVYDFPGLLTARERARAKDPLG